MSRFSQIRHVIIRDDITLGESLPVRKGENDILYSSSAIKRGEVTAIVVSIGDQTYIGHAAALVQSTKRVGHFSAVLNKMGKGLIFGAYICIFIVIIASYFRGADFSTIFALVAGLVVVAVPIALPAVITTTLAVGATELARKHAIVRELGAIESLAAVDVLCTDKVCVNGNVLFAHYLRQENEKNNF